ncbi:olfactory receptor 14J1-like, partial [Myiozetetes cayanensis]|uniref:olfactory receptor 14J1-like n=1 Tax=Myiozetetes cayanensis TaxID=478635 RepID=UPI0021600CE8
MGTLQSLLELKGPFLLHLSLTDLGCICTTVPKAMHNSLWDTTTISYTGCAAQLFFFFFFISTEYSLLTIMCYDRYVAICKPLHYGTLLGSRACAHMFGCFIFIVFSYVQIFKAVLRILSDQGRHKAFSTCLPHLAVVSLFACTMIFAYLKPPSILSPSLDLALSVLYSVASPALNPLIYSLRNQELRDAIRK